MTSRASNTFTHDEPRRTEAETESTPTRTGATTVANWWNRVRYRLYAPVYDWVASPLERGRRRAIERLDPEPGERLLILGCGTGLDLEYLPADVSITAVDLVPTMARRTAARADALGLDVDVRVGDASRLAVADDTFDAVLLHLVLSVVPDPGTVVDEAARVLAPDGRVSIYDKFAPPGSAPSLLRRAVNPLARFLFADLNRRLEPLVADAGLDIEEREAFFGGLYTVTIARHGADGSGGH